jgi:predicted nucleic acid-binding protein
MPESTSSLVFPDINVWMALTYDRHIHHAGARRWFETLEATARLFFCRLTQLGLLRLLTTEAVMGRGEVMTQLGAWEAYDRWLEDGRVSFLDEPPGTERLFRSLSRLNTRPQKIGQTLILPRSPQLVASRW